MEGLLIVNGHVHYRYDHTKKFQAKYPGNFQDRSFLTHIGRIVNRFLTPGTVSKGKSSGWPPISDEIGNVKADKKVAHRDMVFSIFIH
jgi:hypothetical protein